jgi:hypothetical protein
MLYGINYIFQQTSNKNTSLRFRRKEVFFKI